MNRRTRIQVRALTARMGGRFWRTGLIVFLLATAGMVARAQAPADSEVDPLTTAAEQGDAAAQLRLGMRYYYGMGRLQRPEYDEALKWLRLAADQGNADAQDRIGLMYYYGKGVAQDYAEAARWYLLAGHGGNYHAQLQLFDMYQRGVGVPRAAQEARKWLKLANARHPDKTAGAVWTLFAVAVLALIAFALGLIALQRGMLTGSQRLIVALLVHLAGIALVLNSLATYCFWIAFPHCSHNFLATACTQISDPHTRKIVNAIGDWAVVNLIFRFMMIVGLALDALAVWYVVYLCQLLFKRPQARQGVAGQPDLQKSIVRQGR